LLRLGGTNFDVSLNTALPSLGSVLISVPAGHFLQSRANPGRWTLACLGLYWTGFLLLAAVPGMHLGGLTPSLLAVILLFTFSLPAQIFSVGIYPLLGEMVSEQQRIRVFSMRSLINSGMISAVTFVVGQWLNRASFPFNYQVAYGVAWLCGMASLTHLVLASRLLGPRAAAKPATPGPWRLWPADLAQQPDFVHFMLNSLLHNLALWLAGPLYVLYFVRQMGATDAWLGLYATVTSLSAIVGLLFWRMVAERLREPRTVRLTVLSIGFMPLMAGLVPNLNVMLVLTAINGFFAAGINISTLNVMLKTLPEDRQPQFMGLYTAVLNAGAFVAPLLAVAVAGRIGLGPMLVVCGVVGGFGGLAHWVWRVPGPLRSPPALAQPEIEGA
jgi:MFS family permease